METQNNLCQPCNLLIGHAKDSPNILLKAIAYLEFAIDNEASK